MLEKTFALWIHIYSIIKYIKFTLYISKLNKLIINYTMKNSMINVYCIQVTAVLIIIYKLGDNIAEKFSLASSVMFRA